MMQKTKSIFDKYIKLLSDFRNIGLIIFVILVLLVSWSIVGAIQTNYDLQKKISKLEQENTVAELENQNLKLKNEYYNSDEFLELAARRQFGMGAPGEKLMIVPKDLALSKVSPISPDLQVTKVQKPNKPKYQQNFEAWVNWFLHRPTSDN